LTTVTCNAYDSVGNNCPRTFTVLVCSNGYVPNTAGTACVATITAGAYCTYTQGGWGASGNGGSIAATRDRCAAAVSSTGFVIGDTALTYPNKNESPYFARFTTAAALDAFLPAGGPSTTLAADATNPTSTAAGTLAGQVLALTLNVAFDSTTASASGTCRFPRTATIALRDLIYNDASSPLNGDSVATILTKANAFLSRAAPGCSAANFTTAIDRINSNFDNCSSNNGYLKVAPLA
jgi:hypothetical protein